MNVVVRQAGTDRDVMVEVDDPGATIADLAAALGLPEGPGIDVDGRYAPADTPVAEADIMDGATLTSATPHGRPWQPHQPAAWVTVVAGPGTGMRVGLRPNETMVVGRGPDCDLVVTSDTVSLRHAIVTMAGEHDLVVEDAESRNGTWVDGTSVHAPTGVPLGSVIRMGGTVVALEPPDPDDEPSATTTPTGATATTPFNRKPRPALPPDPTPIAVPDHEEPSTASRTFRAAALISPILMGGFLMARNGGDIRYAGFAIISPIAMLVMWLADKRHSRKQGRANAADFDQALQHFATEVSQAWHHHRGQLEALVPSMAEVLRRSRAPSTRLWERRLGHADALRLRLGSTDMAWRPPLRGGDDRPGAPSVPGQSADDTAGRSLGGTTTRPQDPDAQVAAILARHATLPTAPVTVDLLARDTTGPAVAPGPASTQSATPDNAGVVGIVGHGDAPRGLARALLVQATTFHGPADLGVGVFTTPGQARAWEWAKWLPHTRSSDGTVRMLGDRHNVSAGLAGQLRTSLREANESSPGTTPARVGAVPLLVVDDLSLLTGRDAAARLLLAGACGPATGIVIAETVDQLPASCRVIVQIGRDGLTARIAWPASGKELDGVIVAGLDVPRATDAARAIARWDDPELTSRGGDLPDLVRLLPLLGLAEVDATAITDRWARAGVDPGAPATLGATPDGPVTLDLRVDGPHGLVGGTTGSGKSELLRSMIASMAAQADPDHLVFVLVDYKGGSAFDLCADLPHTVGMVTDLDAHLGQRALVSLEAELHHREVVLRDTDAQDLPTYLELGSPAGPLPRLLVVIDEFATMATELPDFLGALVGIAQRGRSLGVHLVLATQRPRGAVDANVRANTNLRIALRVQDPGDSTDIIDVPDAANLPRDRPGRAWIRRGHGDLVLVQSALSTAGAPSTAAPLRVVPFRFTPDAPLPSQVLSGASDLARLVAACQQAFDSSAMATPRKPWLPMPPERINLVDILAMPDQPQGVVIGLEDVPERQAQVPFAWQPGDGHLGLFGMVGQGTTTALVAVATSIAATHDADTHHLYGLDFGGGGLAPLAQLPHTGAIVAGSNVSRQARLMAWLQDEVAARRTLGPSARVDLPTIVVLVDKIGGFLAEHDDVETRSVSDAFQRVVKEGPAVGVVMAITGEATRDLPSRLRTQVATMLAFRMSEAGVGFTTGKVPDLAPGQAWQATNEHVVQVGLPPDVAECAEQAVTATRHVPDPIAVVPDELAFDQVAADRHDGAGPLQLPVGISAQDMSPAGLEVHHGDHVAVIGPPRSGKSGLLQTLSAQLRRTVPDAIQLAVCDPNRSPLAGWPSLDGHGSVDELAKYLELGVTVAGRWVVLVDDAGMVAGSTTLGKLVVARPDLHVITAGRTADMRGGYGGWIRSLRASRTGVLLQPDLPTDGDLLSAKLPRRLTTPLVPGRGFVVNGGVHTLVQFALPPPHPPAGGLATA